MPKRKVLQVRDRPWAGRREYQRFLGPYVEDARTGLYFSTDANLDSRELVAGAFMKLPRAVRALCLDYELTISFSPGYTAAGNSSTFYADFRQSDKRWISPHVEMGIHSLTPLMVLPHFAHETAHLWWRNLPETARQAFLQFLIDTTDDDTVEVTDYVHQHLVDWRKAMSSSDRVPYVANHRSGALARWVEESFCETVAVLQAPSYPSRRSDCNVSLRKREAKIAALANLSLR
jgi:hypothetical protein